MPHPTSEPVLDAALDTVAKDSLTTLDALNNLSSSLDRLHNATLTEDRDTRESVLNARALLPPMIRRAHAVHSLIQFIINQE